LAHSDSTVLTFFRRLLRYGLDAYPRRAPLLTVGLGLALLGANALLGLDWRLTSPHVATAIALRGALYGVCYYGTVLVLAQSRALPKLPRSFWWRSLAVLAVIALVDALPLEQLLRPLMTHRPLRYEQLLLRKATTLLIGLPALGLLSVLLRARGEPLLPGWGRPRAEHLHPFLWMTLGLLPFVALVSFSTGFRHSYPILNVCSAAVPRSMTRPEALALLEGVYLLNFVAVETLWRGALTLWVLPSEARYDATGEPSTAALTLLLPMAVAYVALHLGKPPVEAIASLGGGWLLGVAALRYRQLWGGAWIHLSMAAMMELFAYAQWWLRR